MKKTTWIFGALAILGLTFASCSQDPIEGAGESGKAGQLVLNLKGNTNFVQSRALNESDYNNVNNYTVVVTDKNGTEHVNCLYSEVAAKMPLTLPIGSYTVKAFYGKEHHASRNEFYVEGVTHGNIVGEQNAPVDVECKPTCGRIIVNFDAGMATYFSDYNVVFSGTEALGEVSIDWKKTDVEPWYVKLNEGGETISYVISVTAKDEYITTGNQQSHTISGTFFLERNKGYKMNINPSYSPTTEGGMKISITIDGTTNDIPVDWEIPLDWTK